ncbi:MAG: undecaprenyl/decaprenyl-phosphate alpha-N-acetylglucosaminyl 1-phosphate transferase [Muribaculaceae bacterium]|nr:undecaprenyl/decaprenyl-phosphate alpha-N-acetylglucosaminyl 1-phosphate transferase [Muribaculaceae bacterium]
MDYWIINYIITIGLAVLLGVWIIPSILVIAYRCKLYDVADERKVHTGVVPRLGGISFLPSLGIAICLVVGFNLRFTDAAVGEVFSRAGVQLLFLTSSLLIIYLLGIADDLVGVRYRAKFLFQIIAGILLVVSGLVINDLFGFLWIGMVPEWAGGLLTIFLVIYVLNAINLIDGIDGLASGLSIVGFAWYSWLFYNSGQYVELMISGAALGTLIPFFFFNVFGKASKHTKIFMGDTGSLTIGLLLVYLTVSVADLPAYGGEHHRNVFVLAVAPLIIPCFDVVRVFLHRVRKGRNPFLPDKGHIHHKLLALGMRQSTALIVILLCDAVLIVSNLLLSSCMQPTWILLADIAIWTLINIGLTGGIRKRERRIGKKLYD